MLILCKLCVYLRLNRCVMRRVVLTILLIGFFVGLAGQALEVFSERVPNLKLNYNFPQALGGEKFFVVNDLIVVEASVDGKANYFILDTGSSDLILNRTPKSSAQNIEANALNGEVEVGTTRIEKFTWCGIQLDQPEVYEIDLSGMEQRLGFELAGLVGINVFKDYELFFDFSRQLVIVFPSSTPVLHDYHQVLAKIPLHFQNELPVFEVEIAGQVFKFGLDTGAGNHLIDRKAWQKARLAKDDSAAEYLLNDLSDKQSMTSLSLPVKGKLSPDLEMDFQFLDTDLSYTQSLGYSIDGIVGMPFFEGLQVSIDISEQALYVWGRSNTPTSAMK